MRMKAHMYACVFVCVCVCAFYVGMSTLSISCDYLYTLKVQGVCVGGGGGTQIHP